MPLPYGSLCVRRQIGWRMISAPTRMRNAFARNDANGGMFLRGRFVKRPYTGTVQNQKAHGGLP